MNLKRILERRTGKEIDITYTNNRVSIISFKTEGRKVYLRIQRLFREAPLDVIYEIAELIKNPRMKTPLVNEFFKRNQWRVKKRARSLRKIEPEGRVYNLKKLMDKLNRQYFGGSLDLTITWGRRQRRYAVRKRTLGSYNYETRTIRINPILDSKKVPRYYLEYIIYHEMLHAYLGIRRGRDGRRRIHPPEFKELERQFKHYEKAIKWEKGNS